MTKEMHHKRKVVIIGAGDVGSTFAYALAQHNVAEEIVMIDINQELLQGQVLDLAHGLPFYPPISIRSGSAEDYADARVIVMTAGAKQKSGETRLELLQRNAQIVESVMTDVVNSGSSAVFINVTNPVDILTQVAFEKSGWPRERIIGSGTVLDTARFRYLLSKNCNLDVRNIHAYILGEHGDSEFAAWSMAHIAGIPINEYCRRSKACGDWQENRERIEQEVRDSAYHIINHKGATYYAIGLALVQITSAILRDQHSVLTVSALFKGEYDLTDVALGIPCILSKKGIEQIIEGPMSEDELKKLHNSANVLRGVMHDLKNKSK